MGLLNEFQFQQKEKLPVILQAETAECGLACIAMIANYYRYEIDMSSIRESAPFSLKGALLQDLIRASSDFGFLSRPLRIEMEDMKHLKLPCILHWDLDHFIVLKSIKNDKFVIHDPKSGKQVLNKEAVSKHFTGVALEMTPSNSFEEKKETKRLPIKSLIKNIVGLKRMFLIIILLTTMVQIFTTSIPFLIQCVVDNVILSNNMELIPVLFIGFGILLFFSLIANYLRSKIVIKLSSQLILSFESNLLANLLKLPISFFHKRHVGDILSRFSSLHNIREFFTIGLIEAIFEGFISIITLIILFTYSPLIALIIILGTLIYYLCQFFFVEKINEQSEKELTATAKQNTVFLETLRAIQSIKLYNKEETRQSLWMNLYVNYLNTSIDLFNTKLSLELWSKFINYSLNLFVILLAVNLIINEDITIGMFVAVIAYKEIFSSSSTKFVARLIEFKVLKIHLLRISDIALASKENNVISSPHTVENIKNSDIVLSVKDLSHKYEGEENYIFRNVSFTVMQGESVAIIGSSGVGKSTLIKLLASIIEFKSGEIFYQGISLNKIGLREYRNMIAGVMQDDNLLSGSIMENICFFDVNKNIEHAKKCAKIAEINEGIDSMPMGYSSLIGDMGSILSGGQKQRVLLARALYKRPKILFLDEATSHLDEDLEKKINENLKHINTTKIVIAHRRETIKSADRVLLLNGDGLFDITSKMKENSYEF